MEQNLEPTNLRSDFHWLTGIEDTFINAKHPNTGRSLDEYLLTEHYIRWKEDLALIADLGVDAVRYGVPWYRVCSEQGVYDWSWPEKIFDTLVQTYSIEPVVDLVHYGTPEWMEDSFLHPDYPQFVADYAHAFAEHFKDVCYWYTPLNEPRVNAWYCGRLGWWPPHGRSWETFVRILVQIAKGICLTQSAIQAVEKDAVYIHVDASDFFSPHDPSDSSVTEECRIRQDLVFLALDLATGRVNEGHSLYGWLRKIGIPQDSIRWFEDHKIVPSAIAFNMYPMFSRKEVYKTHAGGVAARIVKSWTETLVEIGRLYHARFPDIPLMIGETGNRGSMARRIKWIEESTAAIMRERESGIPYIGYTYWPLYSLVGWAYQRGKFDLERYVLDMGLYDLRMTENGLERDWTPAVDSYKSVIERNKETLPRAVGE